MVEILVVAGEDSGDMHAASVIKELKSIRSDLSFFGIGSQRMEQAGVELVSDLTHLSSIGFIKPLKNIFFFLRLLKELKQLIKERQPEVAFLVDYSGFNMRVAKIAHSLGVPIVNYFPPSAWVWGEWRANKMASYQATIPSVLPMEAEIYRQAGADVKYVGHPILELAKADLTAKEFKIKESLTGDILIGLLPGSRQEEIDSLLQPMLESARIIKKEYPAEIDFVLPVADSIDLAELKARVEVFGLDITLVKKSSYEVMNAADLLISASGTATLEAACFNTPMIIIYKTGKLNYLLSKRLVKISYVGLPNIIAGKEIVPELLQDQAKSNNIATEALEILNSTKRQTEMKAELKDVVAQLATDRSTITQVAEILLESGGLNY